MVVANTSALVPLTQLLEVAEKMANAEKMESAKKGSLEKEASLARKGMRVPLVVMQKEMGVKAAAAKSPNLDYAS